MLLHLQAQFDCFLHTHVLTCSRYWRTKVHVHVQMMSLTSVFVSVMYYKADRSHVVMHLLSNRSKEMSKCGKNISSFCIFLPHFVVICDLQLY